MNGTYVKIPFHMTEGDDFLLFGNEIIHQSNLDDPGNLLIILLNVKNLSKSKILVQIYDEDISSSDSQAVRTYLLVVLSKFASSRALFSTYCSLYSSNGGID